MIITTTPSIDGHIVSKYHGVVTSHIVEGVNAFKEFGGAIRDVVGGRSGIYEKVLGKADGTALKELMRQAKEAGANAVIGVDIDYASIEIKGSMIMVVACGTAVTIEPIPDAAVIDGKAQFVTPQTAIPRVEVQQDEGDADRHGQARDLGGPVQSDRYGTREIGSDFDHDR
jgi:uncharacterized protein YbjQ (UPF0145 family)